MNTKRFKMAAFLGVLALPLSLTGVQEARAQADAAEVARKLNNPIASLISLPMQLNYDTALGPDGIRAAMSRRPAPGCAAPSSSGPPADGLSS